jgi:hypothetical protein
MQQQGLRARSVVIADAPLPRSGKRRRIVHNLQNIVLGMPDRLERGL